MQSNKLEKYLSFLDESIEYFQRKIEGIDRDRYISDRDVRSILDKTINDIILCTVDISKELLKNKKRNVPDTYKDIVLACFEFVGKTVLKVAPLTSSRNETIHQYLKINWQNIINVKKKLYDIEDFATAVKETLGMDKSMMLEQRYKNLIHAIELCDPGLVSLELNTIKNNYNLREFVVAKGPYLAEITKKLEFKESDPTRIEKLSQIVRYLRNAEIGGDIGIEIKNKTQSPPRSDDDFIPK